MDQLTDLIPKVSHEVHDVRRTYEILQARKKDIEDMIVEIAGYLLKEDYDLKELFKPANYIVRKDVFNIYPNCDFIFCDTLESFIKSHDFFLKWCNDLNNFGKILQSNRQEILSIIGNLNNIALSIIPISQGICISDLVKREKNDQGFYLFGNRGIDFASFKNRKDIASIDLSEYLQLVIHSSNYVKKYVAMFIESEDNDMLYQEMLIENGFVKMDLYTAIFIYRITGLFFKDIYLTNPDKQKSEYSFSLDWVSGKDCDGDHYDNPTILIHYHDGVLVEKKYKFIKVLQLP